MIGWRSLNKLKRFMKAQSSSMPKVLFVDHAAVLSGAELVLLDLAIAYRHTSQVLLFDEGPFRERLEAAGVNVLVKPAADAALSVRASTGLSALKSIPALWAMAQDIVSASRGFDLIHANSQKAFIAAAIARRLGAPPVIWHLHDILTAQHFSRINRRIAVALGNTCTAKVLVNSKATGAAFVAAGGRESLVELLYNGLPLEAFEPPFDTSICTELGIGDAPLVGVFSRLSYWKGQHVLLEAVRQVPGVHVLVVGGALFGEEEYVTRLKQMAIAPDLSGRVHWLGFRDDIPALMSACTIVAHTSTEPEPFGRVIVEGQLAERPVIATAAGGAVELIQNGVTGCLVPPNDSPALAQAIQSLLNNPEWASRLAQQGKAEAQAHFSLEGMLAAFDQALGI
jgi:glycosyltransferase involved in cell wall biosynthesis